ncbi:MAG: hypothetical protein ACRCT8_15195 [Lacipirellulaceae bacterium]
MIHLVRVGAMGHVGRFRSAEGLAVPRERRVVVRTSRGLEVGEVLALDPGADVSLADGELLRPMGGADELLAERLERNRLRAYEACAGLLAERGSRSVLMDVEHLFDGRGLFFYYLGDVDPIAAEVSGDLASAYDAEAQFGQFADALNEGCGPGCGTAEAVNGCGGDSPNGGGCATCSVAKACGR